MGVLLCFQCSDGISRSASSEPLHFSLQRYHRYASLLPLCLFRVAYICDVQRREVNEDLPWLR